MHFEYSKINHKSMGSNNIFSRYLSDYFPSLGAMEIQWERDQEGGKCSR